MAIKGDLNNFSFAEILKLVSKFDGVLKVADQAADAKLECCLQNRNIVCAQINGERIFNKDFLKSRGAAITGNQTTVWEFVKQPVESANAPLISVSEWIGFALSKPAATDFSDNQLPHLDTKYISVKNSEITLESRIGEFWNLCSGILRDSCSGSDICWQLGLDAKAVRVNLHTLRSVGMIKPLRIFEITDSQERLRMVMRNFELARLRSQPAAPVLEQPDFYRQMPSQPAADFGQASAAADFQSKPAPSAQDDYDILNGYDSESSLQPTPSYETAPAAKPKTEISTENVGLVKRMLRSIFG